MKKILLLCVSSQSVLSFRKELIFALKENGFDVGVVTFDNKYKSEIVKLGVDFYCICNDNRSTSILDTIKLKKAYSKLIQEISPDITFSFMLKPNIFGNLAAHKQKIKTKLAMVEGAGDVFSNNGFKWKLLKRIVCIFYKRAFKHVQKVFFLNNDDEEEFIKLGLVNKTQTIVIPSIGVDINKFTFTTRSNAKVFSFIMIARMIKSKGVYEYCEVARRIKKKYYYLGLEGEIRLNDIDSYIKNKDIEYLGFTDNVNEVLKTMDVLVLPSYYREGIPMSILEAESSGCAIVTTNSIGCKETVVNGLNGFLVKKKDVNDLFEKIEILINNPSLVTSMGIESRKLVEEKFDSQRINRSIIQIIESEVL